MKKIFHIFDEDNSGTVSSLEMANCMSLMCGGSINHKISAAFLLFDVNNSNTLSMDELSQFLTTIFHCIFRDEIEKLLPKVDFTTFTVRTANKCFEDLQIPK